MEAFKVADVNLMPSAHQARLEYFNTICLNKRNLLFLLLRLMRRLNLLKAFLRHKRSSTQNTAWIYFSSFATNFICLALGMVSGIIAARLLGPEERGALAILTYYPSLIGSFFVLGNHYSIKYMLSQEPEKESEISTVGFRLSLILGVIGAITFALCIPYTLKASERDLASAVVITCLMAPVMVINPCLYAIHQGKLRFGWVNLMLILSSGGYVILLIGLWMTKTVSPLRIVVATSFLVTIIVFLNLRRVGFEKLNYPVSFKNYRSCLNLGLKFFVPSVMATLFCAADRAILIRVTTLKEIGYYSVAFSLTFPLTLAVEVFSQVGFVEVSGTKDETTSSALILRRFHTAQAIVFVSALFVFAVVYPLIKFGFGTEFLPATAIALFMIPAMALRGLANMLDSSLRAKGLAFPGTVANLLALICLVGLGLWWVPSGGGRAFAVALLSAQTLSVVILINAMRLFLGLPLSRMWGIRPNVIIDLLRHIIRLAQFQKA
jgi:antigen flippase